MVIKRSLAAGYAGIENPLYYLDKTLVLFGNARNFVGSVVGELSGGGGSEARCRGDREREEEGRYLGLVEAPAFLVG
jgi:NAD(P) transhydrogenase beta subunit